MIFLLGLSVTMPRSSTGASSGIGRATCIALAAKGWNLALTGRRLEELNKTVNLVQSGESPSSSLSKQGNIVVVGDINEEDFVAR